MPPNTSLQPVNRGALLMRLVLSQHQLAVLCGVTVRQVQYWARLGYLPHAPDDPTRFNGDAVDLYILIKQALTQDASLREVGPAAQAYLADQLRAQPQLDRFDPATRAQMAGNLRAAERNVQVIREVLAALIPPSSDSTQPSNPS